MNLYAYSVVATMTTGGTQHIRHAAGLVRAASYDEALGVATRIGWKCYPPIRGWKNQNVTVEPSLEPITPETTRDFTDDLFRQVSKS